MIAHYIRCPSTTTQFHHSAKQIQDTSHNHIQDIFHAMDSMSKLTTTFIQQQQDSNGGLYPPGFVTIPNQDILLGSLRSKTQAVLVAYAPRMETQDHVTLWNQYYEEMYSTKDTNTTSSSSRIWTLQPYNDKDDQIIDDFWFCPSTTSPEESTSMPEEINHIGQTMDEFINGTILTPLWSVVADEEVTFPTSASLVNWNAFSDPAFRDAVQIASNTGQTVFQDMKCTSPILWSKKDNSSDDPMDQLTSVRNMIVVTPVYAELPTRGNSTYPKDVVGYVLAIVPWTTVVQGAITKGNTIHPVDVVIEDICQAKEEKALFTMHVQNDINTVLISDTADAHDDDLSAFQFPANLSALANVAVADGKTTVPCWLPSHEDDPPLYGTTQYTIIVYPTVEFQETYETDAPIIYASVVLGTFLLVSVSFLLFNYAVEKTQKKLLLTAQKQNAIVSSLFPKVVKKQLMETVVLEEQNLKNFDGNSRHTKSHEIDCGRSTHSGVSSCNSFTTTNQRNRPVADLFPETTIMFADIVGFTDWSTCREPSQVFILLESIFGEFDSLAKRRRVYKVEVVGDCYVGVCGLPDPSKRHAVVMAKFALACMEKMDTTTQKLKDELGPETAELQLRVGLHSGPVVAGVLRGDRTRFQLFGDSMNTASRMKSTGLPNRIQVSQETATRLEREGKGDWLKARSNRVVAKGKGEMQTYFLSVVRKSSTTSSGADGPRDVDDDELIQ
jgi:class 3 adenylate cyclase